MAELKIIWTALPNGLKRDGTMQKLKLSVFVSPRLRLDADEGKLGQFPDLVTWPARLLLGRFSINVIVDNDDAHPVAAEIVTKPAPDPTFWAALFDRSTFVRTHEFPTQREPTSSYEVDTLQRNLYRGFGEVGQATPYRHPDNATLRRAFPHVFAAVEAGATPVDLDGRDDVATMSEEQLTAEHREMAEELLRSDERTSFDSKLARMIELAGALARRPDAKEIPIVPRTDNPVSAIAQFVAFHRRPARRHAGRTAKRDSDADRIDFHQALGALGEYPDLLRRLGLVIDLEISGPVPQSLFGDAELRRIRVQPRFVDGGFANTAYTPNTKYLLDTRPTGSPLPFPIFAAAPQRAEAQHAAPLRDLEIVAGLLNLGMPMLDGSQQFSLVQVDVDGAMTKVLNTVDAIARDEQRPTHPIDQLAETSAPAFRSSGISLVRSGNASALIDGIRRAKCHQHALQDQRPADFFAEDLVRGYRIDVRCFPANAQFGLAGEPLAPSPPWLSLQRRVGRYVARPDGSGSVTLSDIVDEGFIQPAFVQDIDAGTPAAAPVNPIYVQESMFLWNGWSLAAPPPANPVNVTPQLAPPEHVAPIGLPQLELEFAPVPGTLPRLRFGNFYQVRARTVDLAGNGLTLDEADGVMAALAAQGSPTPISNQPGKFRYRRFEPISPPEPVLREVLTAGETVDVMVIRSNGSTAAAYAASLGDTTYKGVSERHIVPPKAALTTIETHGRLDGAFGGAGNPGVYYNICRRESGTLNDSAIININTGNPEPLPDYSIPNSAGGTTMMSNGIRFVQVPPGPGGYTVHYEAQLRVPYLPDPLARGVALFGLPGVNGTSGELDERGDLKYSDAEHQVLAIPATRDLGFLTKIDFGPTDKWPDFLPFRLKLDELASDAFPIRPKWSKATRELTVRLAPGQTVTIWLSSYPANGEEDLFGLHAWWKSQAPPSTDPKHFLKMAQHGALSMLSPPRKILLVHAVQQPVKPPIESSAKPFQVVKFEKATTGYIDGAFKIHSSSTAKLDLLAEWKEQGEGPDDTGQRKLNTHVFEVGIPPAPPTAGGAKPIATFDSHLEVLEFQAPNGSAEPAERYLSRHEFGDTKYRRVNYRLVATTRFREYFPDNITGNPDNLTRTFPKLGVVIPSSAKPPPPEISYIVPSFGWIVDRIGTRVTQSVRRGGGLRVYLGEKWYASGADEQLAIVEAAGFSQWGFDPVHVPTGGSSATPIVPDAPAATAPGLSFSGQLHPYDVHFDPEQKLWYSDISFRVGDKYFPFRQLALARYQRNSLPGLHVSSVVYTGVHQLAPDRAVTLGYANPTTADPNHRRVTITVIANAMSATEAVAAQPNGSPIVEVVLEERDIARKNWDANLGWKLAEPSQQPVVDRPPSQSQLWIGHVLLPREPGPKQRRLVIREVEVFPANTSPSGQAWIGDPTGAGRRLVYADTIPLD